MRVSTDAYTVENQIRDLPRRSAARCICRFWHEAADDDDRLNGRFCDAGSSGRCNTSIKSFGWSCKSQSLAWSFVELPSHFVELGLRVHGQVSPLRQVLPQQTVGVLIGTTLPRTLRIAEVNVDIGRQRQAPMIRKLLAAVPGQRLIQLIRYRLRLLDQRGNNTAATSD